MSYSKKIADDFKIVFIGTYVSAFLGYLLRLYLARRLSLEDYGLTFSVIAMFGLFGILSDFGLGSALTKFIPEYIVKKQYKNIKTSFLTIVFINSAIAFIVGIIFIFFSKVISNAFLKDYAWLAIVLYSIYFIFTPLLNALKSSFRGFGKILLYTATDVLLAVLLLVETIILLIFNFGVYSIFISYATYGIVTTVVFYKVFIKKVFPKYHTYTFKYNPALSKKLFGFGIFIAISNLFGSIFGRLDTIMLTMLSSLKQTAYFQASFPLARALWDVGTIFGVVMLPIISEAWTRKHYEELKKDIENILLIFFILSIPVIIVLYTYSNDIIRLLYGNEYLPAAISLKILSAAIFLKIFTKINNTILLGIGKPSYLLKYVFIGALLNIICNILLIPKFGAQGASYSLTISFSFILVYSTIETFREIKISFNYLHILLIAILNLAYFVIAQYLNFQYNNNLIIIGFGLLIISVAYIIIIFALKIIDMNYLLHLIGIRGGKIAGDNTN